MALKDRLEDALQATAPENAARLATLNAVKAASGSGSDSEIQSAIAAILAEREQKAASFSAAGQSDLARAERAEIDTLRTLLRSATPPPPTPHAAPKAAPKKTAAAPSEEPAAAKPLIGKNQMIVGLIAIALAFVAGYFVFGGGSDKNKAASTAIVVRADDRTLGDPKAPIVLLEYAAPTCPHCARFAMTTMPKIKAEYIDKGKVFYIFRTFPLQPTDGAVEGIARVCLPADKYFQFLDLMFRNQPKWDPDGYQIPDVHGAIVQMARVMGISPEDADRCMTDPKEQTRINDVAQEAVAKYNLHQTPTLIINGTVVQDTESSWQGLKAKFDSLLAKK